MARWDPVFRWRARTGPIRKRLIASSQMNGLARRISSPDTSDRKMAEVEVQGVHRVEIRDDQGGVGAADVELRFRRVRVLPPIGKQKRYPALSLTVIHARERDAPADRPAIDLKLITDLPVTTCAEAVEKLRWYALRWKVEVFHKILKAGCRAEEAR